MTFANPSGSDLNQILKRRIAERGPLSVSEYMETALYHPELGYYIKAKPIGAEGDFVTAPEISQMFGELIGLWCVQAWRDMGRPAQFRWIELGPGRGTLMQDALRAASQDPHFIEAAQICLVEKNEYLKTRQATALHTFTGVEWYADLGEIPDAPSIVIANEFFDCLPIDQFVFKNQNWFERQIGLDASGELAFQTGDAPVAIAHRPGHAVEGDISESCPAAEALVKSLVARLLKSSGRALIIDYGYPGPAIGDTLQAIGRHKFADVLQTPGQVDITAHVDFTTLSNAAGQIGAAVDGPVEQGTFLTALGLDMRAETLKARATETQASAITAATDRLAHPDQMGQLFKVLSLSSPGLPVPPGFPDEARASH